MGITRREFIRTSGLVVIGAGLAACSSKEGNGGPLPDAATIDDIIGDRTQGLSYLAVGTELLPSIEERLTFGLGTTPQLPDVIGATGRLWVAKTRTEQALGPFDIVFHGDGLGDHGYYEAMTTFPSDGQWLVLVEAVTDEGTVLSAGNVQVGRQTTMPIPGDEPVRVPTPTTKDARGVDPICTRIDPQNPGPCGMHARSLDEALDDGDAIALIIATPAFCTSNLCGPEVELLDGLRPNTSGVTFIHIEVYENDDPDTILKHDPLSPAAAAWHLDQEPATYLIKGGTILERLLGPADRETFRSALATLTA